LWSVGGLLLAPPDLRATGALVIELYAAMSGAGDEGELLEAAAASGLFLAGTAAPSSGGARSAAATSEPVRAPSASTVLPPAIATRPTAATSVLGAAAAQWLPRSRQPGPTP
jgi:hypothetical protein